jgi:hypothetical protein
LLVLELRSPRYSLSVRLRQRQITSFPLLHECPFNSCMYGL